MEVEMENVDTALRLVRDYVLSRCNKGQEPPEFETVPVWYGYVLGAWKALVTTGISDGMYYEVTFDKDANRCYVDAYKRWENVVVDMEKGV